MGMAYTGLSVKENRVRNRLHPVVLQQEVHEHPHSCRHRCTANKHGMNRLLIPRVPCLQQWHQSAALQVRSHAERTDARDAGTFLGQLRQCLAAAAFDVTGDFQGKLAAVADKRPIRFGTAEIEAQAVVLQQVFRFMGRAMALQVFGRCHHDLAGVADPARGQGTVGQVAEAHRDIGLAAENVDHFVAQGKVDDDVRITGAERRHQGHDDQAAVAEGGADPQPAFGHALV